MQFPYTCTGSLCPGFPPARHVCLPVKHPYAIALCKAAYQTARGYLWKPPLRFWRRPPQSNCPPSSVPATSGLGLRRRKGRISRMAPRMLAHTIQCLRPILHIRRPSPVLSCSKGSRGLFVPSRVIGIFTDTTISLGSWLRLYTSSFEFAQPCVFAKQLPGPILCASITGGPLLPKLRGQFA